MVHLLLYITMVTDIKNTEIQLVDILLGGPTQYPQEVPI